MIKKKKKLNRLILFSVLIIPILYSNFLIVSRANILIENTLQDEEILENCFIHTINGRNYLAEYITSEKVEELKEKMVFRDPNKDYNVIIDGHGTGLSDPTEEDLEQYIGNIVIKKLIRDEFQKVPTSHDLSEEKYFPVVGNQGGQGSCAAWASTYYAYGYIEARDNEWDASSGNPKYLMSPAWSFNKISLGIGSSMSGNWAILLNFGTATMDTMPYDASDAINWGSEAAWREAPKHKPLKQYKVNFDEANPDETVELIKDFISSGTPLPFGIDANEYGNGFNDGNYIISAAELGFTTGAPHANCIVGYDDSIQDDGEIGAFKVVNSWGNKWGDSGFYWLTYNAYKDLKREVYVIEDREDYQPNLIATLRFDNPPLRMLNIITLGIGSYDSPLETFTPGYRNDENNVFPEFMALDITEFNPQLISDKDLNFFLEIDSSSSTGTISSFKIERYESGSLLQVSDESPDVPGSIPGHVNNHFKMLISSPVIVQPEIPIIPLIIVVAALSTVGIVVVKRKVSKSKSPVQSKIPVKGNSNKLIGSKHASKKIENPSKQGIKKSRPTIVINQNYKKNRNQRIHPLQARIPQSRYQPSRNIQERTQRKQQQQSRIPQSRYQPSRNIQERTQRLQQQQSRTQQSRYQNLVKIKKKKKKKLIDDQFFTSLEYV